MKKMVNIRFVEETEFQDHVEHPDTLMRVTEAEATSLFRKGVAVPHGPGEHGTMHGRAVVGIVARSIKGTENRLL